MKVGSPKENPCKEYSYQFILNNTIRAARLKKDFPDVLLQKQGHLRRNQGPDICAFMTKVCAMYGMIVCRSTDECSKSGSIFMSTKLPSRVLSIGL